MKPNLRNLCYTIIFAFLFWSLFGIYQPVYSATIDRKQARHIIERLSFGITPLQAAQLSKNVNLDSYIEAQLNPLSIKESVDLTAQLAQFDTLYEDPISLYLTFQQYNVKGKNAPGLSAKEKEELQQRKEYKNKVVRQTKQARLVKAIASERQLQEVMTNFWLDHFNVFGFKKTIPFWLADYETELRSNALGNFHDLLSVTAHHPAMLVYLDNDLNAIPKKKSKRSNDEGVNENYARELMELHTLGVDGGYTQQDVEALARILTGWGVDYDPALANVNNFRFYEQRHDFSDKVFLGQTIAGSGIAEGEEALKILANHPATARFISYKLAQYFVADNPPESLVKNLTQTFIESQGNIKTVLDKLFHSSEFNDSQYYNAKFKTPWQYLVSIARASGIEKPNLLVIERMLNQLSMPIYRCQTPDGYKNTEEAWLNPNALLRRLSYVTSIAKGSLSDKKPLEVAVLQKTIGNSLTDKTKKAIAKSPEQLKATLILGSPEMMYR